MVKFMTHEPLERGIFNSEYTSGQGTLSPWSNELSNTTEVLDLLLVRLESDFERLNPRMRKAYGAKDVETCKGGPLYFVFFKGSVAERRPRLQEQLQRNCAAYVACRALFKQKYPSKFVEAELDLIEKSPLVS